MSKSITLSTAELVKLSKGRPRIDSRSAAQLSSSEARALGSITSSPEFDRVAAAYAGHIGVVYKFADFIARTVHPQGILQIFTPEAFEAWEALGRPEAISYSPAPAAGMASGLSSLKIRSLDWFDIIKEVLRFNNSAFSDGGLKGLISFLDCQGHLGRLSDEAIDYLLDLAEQNLILSI